METIVSKFAPCFHRGLVEYAQSLGLLPESGVKWQDIPLESLTELLIHQDYAHKGSLNPPEGLASELYAVLETDPQLQPGQRPRHYEICSNLRRDNSIDLRIRLVSGQVTIDQLVNMTSEDMAPESLKRRRQLQREKAVQDIILIDHPRQTMRKTHKGLEPVPEPRVKPNDEAADGSRVGAGDTPPGEGELKPLDLDPALWDCPFPIAEDNEALQSWRHRRWLDLDLYCSLSKTGIEGPCQDPEPVTLSNVIQRLRDYNKDLEPFLSETHQKTLEKLLAQASTKCRPILTSRFNV